MQYYKQEWKRFCATNKKMLSLLFFLTFLSLICFGLWWWLGGIPRTNDWAVFVLKQKDYFLWSFLIMLFVLIQVVLAAILNRTVYFYCLSLCFMALFMISLISNIKHDNEKFYLNPEYSDYLSEMKDKGDYAALDRFFKDFSIESNLTLSETVTDYIKAQAQIESGKPAPYLERTVSALRQGDETLNGYDAETLYVLERAYDGQVLSRPARSFEQRHRLLKWLWLPSLLSGLLALIVIWRKMKERRLWKQSHVLLRQPH